MGFQSLSFKLLPIIASLFIVYIINVSGIQPFVQRGVFLCIMLILCFKHLRFSKTSNTDKPNILDYTLIVLSIITCLYVVIYNEALLYHFGIPTRLDLILGIIFLIIMLESTRRSAGVPLFVIAILALLYGKFGYLIPGRFGCAEYSIDKIIGMLYITTNGIWGFILAFVVSTLAMFIILGAFLNVSGAGQYFIRFAQVVGSGRTGGPAKVAILGSFIFGSVTGSAVANVTATGTFTIPAMKEAGYPNRFAGAVEATASSGGQLMPPIMGAGAFIMAELLQISYITVVKAALVPAIFYYLSLWLGVHFGAHKFNIPPTPKEPFKRDDLIGLGIFFILPLSVLMFYLFMGYTPAMSAFRATLVCTLLCFYDVETKSLQIKKGFYKIVKSLETGGQQLMSLTVMMASIGIIVSVINMTGVGLTIANVIINIGKHSLLLSLLLTMVVSLILGLGLPTVAAYVVAGIVGAPALIELGVPPIATHLFIFYFAILSAITPPVCIAVMVASSIAEANWIGVAIDSIKIGFPVFIIPFIFCFYPSILLNAPLLPFVSMILSAFFGIVGMIAGTIGYFKNACAIWERCLLIIGGFSLLLPGTLTNIIGIIVLGLIYLKQSPKTIFSRFRREKDIKNGLA